MVYARPNIIYLMWDQARASALRIGGNRHMPAGLADELASRGITFTQAYSASSICTPSRTTVFTGVHPLVHQVTCHQNRAPYNLPQLSELLQKAGYFTAAFGHYEVDRNLTRGWHEQARHDETGDLGSAYRQWLLSATPKDVGWGAGSIDCDAADGSAHLLTTRALHVLDGIEAMGMPYFLHVAYLEPHAPYFAPAPYDTLIDRDTLPLPDAGEGKRRPAWQALAREQIGSDRATEDDIRRVQAVYYGMCAYADDQMRRLLDEIESRGLLENTWIIISSDHGDYLGERGLFAKTESLYECLLHVPLVIVPPREAGLPPMQIDHLVDLADLFPTILGIAGAPAPEYAQGSDLIEWARGGAGEPLHDCVFAQVGDYHGKLKTTVPTGKPAAGRHPSLLQGARTQEFSYVRDPDYGDEAYDLSSDPKELDNLLADGADAPPEVAELRRRVDEWEAECLRLRQELGVIPGYRGFALEGSRKPWHETMGFSSEGRRIDAYMT